MTILDDLRALGADPASPQQVTRALLSLAAAPSARIALAREWSDATGLILTEEQFAQLRSPG